MGFQTEFRKAMAQEPCAPIATRNLLDMGEKANQYPKRICLHNPRQPLWKFAVRSRRVRFVITGGPPHSASLVLRTTSRACSEALETEADESQGAAGG